MLRAKRKTLIQTAIEGNIVPQRSKSSSDLLLRLGNNKHAKLQQRGKTTPAGRFYFAQTQTTPETYDIQGTVVQRGSTEFLVTNGKARVLRRLVGNEYTYTRLGRQFFNAKKTSYLVHVPAVIKKSFSNSRGREFMVPHNAFMYEQLVLSANLNEAERKEQLKSKVLAFMESNLDRINGRIVLYHDSDPVLYDENGQWTFDEQKTVQQSNGEMQTETTLDRPLGATPLLAANILLPEGLCKEAFEDSQGNCVAVQLSALLKIPLDRIELEIDGLYRQLAEPGQYEIDGIQRSWREMGVTSRIIAQLGLNHGMNVYVLSQGRKIAQFKHGRRGNRACLCFTVDSDHAWFYETENVRRSISHLGVNNSITELQGIVQDFKSTRAEYRTWREWFPDTKETGYFDTEDLIYARSTYLDNNISPKVTWQAGEITALHVPLYKQHVYKKPAFANSLLRWSEELSHAGYDVPYRGEGISSYTHAVVLALIKNRRRKVPRADRFKILEQYGHCCSQCGDKGDSFGNHLELDHPVPLRDCGDNEQGLVPLCSNCHSHKSYLECLTPFQENPLASVFERSVYAAFHESPKPKQAVQQLQATKINSAIEIDAVRCRRNGLDQNTLPLPIFAPIDQIQVLDECVLGD